MKEATYQKFLKKAPEDHNSEEFLQFLRDNNVVRFENRDWLVIQNKKYWTKKNDWLTCFWKGFSGEHGDQYKPNLLTLMEGGNHHELTEREWLKKARKKQSVKIFHIHIYKK